MDLMTLPGSNQWMHIYEKLTFGVDLLHHCSDSSYSQLTVEETKMAITQ